MSVIMAQQSDENHGDLISETKTGLGEALETLSLRHGWVHNGKPSIISVAKLLTSNVCERRTLHLLTNPNSEERKKFDSIYREKSQYATLKILDHLKSRLIAEGINAQVATETRSDFGIYDVTIMQGEPCSILRNGEQKVRLEIKASLGLPLEQLERYLWDDSPIIVIRVITGQVTLFRPREMRELVLFSTSTVLEKSLRLMNGSAYIVPGNYCSYCPDIDCQFNKSKQRTSNGMLVKMSDGDFGDDINSFFKNLPYVADKTASLVVQELKNDASNDDEPV